MSYMVVLVLLQGISLVLATVPHTQVWSFIIVLFESSHGSITKLIIIKQALVVLVRPGVFAPR